MKKTASILAFVLGLGFLITSLSMVREDGKNAAGNITDDFRLLNDGNRAALDRSIQDSKDRKDEERNYALIGAVGVIAGFALWPRQPSISRTEDSPASV